MAAKLQGVQARIKRLNPLAMFTHCTSHQLNLALTHACSERSITNASGTIWEVTFLKILPQELQNGKGYSRTTSRKTKTQAGQFV